MKKLKNKILDIYFILFSFFKGHHDLGVTTTTLYQFTI
jgi:hypothetical protein